MVKLSLVFVVPQLDGFDEDSDEEVPTNLPPISPLEFAELMDIEYGVDEYFWPEELEQMSHIELRRYKNLRANYEVLKAMGKDCSIYHKWGCTAGLQGPKHCQ